MTVETAAEEQAPALTEITDRAARARAVLALAERRTGARSLTVADAPAAPAPRST
ncbi:hypothetical protein [Cellulomonas soli]